MKRSISIDILEFLITLFGIASTWPLSGVFTDTWNTFYIHILYNTLTLQVTHLIFHHHIELLKNPLLMVL